MCSQLRTSSHFSTPLPHRSTTDPYQLLGPSGAAGGVDTSSYLISVTLLGFQWSRVSLGLLARTATVPEHPNTGCSRSATVPEHTKLFQNGTILEQSEVFQNGNCSRTPKTVPERYRSRTVPDRSGTLAVLEHLKPFQNGASRFHMPPSYSLLLELPPPPQA